MAKQEILEVSLISWTVGGPNDDVPVPALVASSTDPEVVDYVRARLAPQRPTLVVVE